MDIRFTDEGKMEESIQAEAREFNSFAKKRLGPLYHSEVQSFLFSEDPKPFILAYGKDRYEKMRSVFDEWMTTRDSSKGEVDEAHSTP